MSPGGRARFGRTLFEATSSERAFQIHATAWFAVSAFLFLLWLIVGPYAFPWFLIPAGGWGIGLAVHATATFTNPRHDDEIEPGDSQPQLGRGAAPDPR